MTQLSILFGALAPSLVEQLKEQGLQFKKNADATKWQKAFDSYIYLKIYDFYTETEKRRFCKKFVKRISKQVERCPEGEGQ